MIIYNGKSSYTDFDLYVAAKEIPAPQRKVITETVPYMSGVWDFSYHDNGVDEYEASKLEYSFDVIADNKRELSEQKAALLAWSHEKTDGKLYDTDISLTRYFKVYHAQASWSENDLQGLLKVEFLCYPFMLTDKTVTQTLTATAQSITVENAGNRAIMPTIEVEANATISNGTNSYTLSAGTYNGVLTLEKGANTITAKGEGLLRIEYAEEAF